MDITLHAGKLSGRYKILVFKSDDCVYSSDWFDNLLTDTGMDQICNSPLGTGGVPYLFPYAFVGTGNTTPAFTDTSLDQYLATSGQVENTGTLSYVSGTVPYWRYVRTYTFTAGTVTGKLAEVGVGYSSSTLFSRALIADAAGNVSPVTVLSDEGIQLIYELRSYINPDDVAGSVTIAGNIPGIEATYATVTRPAAMTTAKAINIGVGYTHTNVALYSGAIQANNLVPLGSSTSLTTYAAPNVYTPGSFTCTVPFTFLETDGNYVGGVPAVRVSNSQCDFQIGFTPPIPKSTSYILSFNITFVYSRA